MEDDGEVINDPELQVRGVQLTPRSPREAPEGKENVVSVDLCSIYLTLRCDVRAYLCVFFLQVWVSIQIKIRI